VLGSRFSAPVWRCQIPLLPRLLSQLPQPHRRGDPPGARIGSGVFIDARQGVVIGKTSEIGNPLASLYRGVTLGGTARCTQASPTLGENVRGAAPAPTVLGAISVGSNTRKSALDRGAA